MQGDDEGTPEVMAVCKKDRMVTCRECSISIFNASGTEV